MKKTSYIASVSFGKDSLAMLLKLIDGGYSLDKVVYYEMDGAEFDCVLRNMERMKPILAEKGIEFIHLKPEHSFSYYMLEKPFTKRNGLHQDGYKWCGGTCRWGTALKLNAIENYYRACCDVDEIVEYVGIASDEYRRTERMADRKHTKVYPLVKWNMTEAMCLMYCHEKGFYWIEQDGTELYDILDRISCKYCRNKNLHELRNIYHYIPKLWEELKAYQSQIDMPFYHGMSIFDLEKRFEMEGHQLTLFDLEGGKNVC